MKTNELKTNELKNKVISLLIKWGSNSDDAAQMVNTHFDRVSGYCHTAKSIAECIGTIA